MTDGVNGLLCPIDDPAALAAQLNRAAGDAALRARLAEAGMKAYLADFTREIVTDRLIACYEACIRLGKRA